MISQAEKNALSLLTQSCKNAQIELSNQLEARKSLIELLENKYKAKFNEIMGVFEKDEK